MPLHYITAPQNGLALVQAGLNRLEARGPNRPHALGAVDFRTLTMKPPHAVYDLHADEIAKGGGLETAHSSAVRYLVEAAGTHVAAAEVQVDGSGKATLLANVNYGPFVSASAAELARLETLDQVRQGSFEARLLRFSAAALVAIWLKSDPGGTDLIVPLAPAPAPLKAGTLYSEADFLRAIVPIAQKRTAVQGAATVP